MQLLPSRLRRLGVPCLALLVAAFVCWSASSAQANVGYPASGGQCFSIGNGGLGDFPDDGYEFRKVDTTSFEVAVRWQKSALCPLPGTLEVELQDTVDYRPCLAASQLVYTSGGHYQNWVRHLEHDGTREPSTCHDAEFEHLVPGATIRVRVNLSYLGYHFTDWKPVTLDDDPATNLGDVDVRADSKTIVAGGRPQGSLYGVSKIAWAIRDPSDRTSRFDDGIVPAYTCAPGPLTNYAKREIKGCWRNPEIGIHEAPSDSPQACPKGSPCEVPLLPDHLYEVRQVVDNNFSGRTWGPVKQIKTGP